MLAAPPGHGRLSGVDINESMAARFWAKVNKDGPVPPQHPELGPCWLWKPLGSVHGYGQFTFQGKTHLAHRVAHEIGIGPIPDGLTIDHLCEVRSCVRPSHLEAVTRAENLRRARCWENGASFQRAKTHCSAGHAYSGDNLRLTKDGRRACRTCERGYSAASRARRRTENPSVPKPPKEFCTNGHAYAEYGVIRSGKRLCIECERAKTRRYRARLKESRPPSLRELGCVNGHPWTPENTYTTKQGFKACRACHNARTLAAYHAKKAAQRQSVVA